LQMKLWLQYSDSGCVMPRMEPIANANLSTPPSAVSSSGAAVGLPLFIQ
jgi:hypothetical protein